MFPGARIYTLFEDRSRWEPWMHGHEVISSVLNFLPNVGTYYRKLLPIFPVAVRLLRVSGDAEILISSDASLIKGVRVSSSVVHICYCHSPPRYLWDQQDEYVSKSTELGVFGRVAFRLLVPFLRSFDKWSASQVNYFIANSDFVASRIARCYKRESVVIHPPVEITDFRFRDDKEDFYLVVSELVPYKRIDLAVDAFSASGRRLLVVGDGPERKSLQNRAGNSIEFLGRVSYENLIDIYSRAKAFIFPGIEDFGITPLESMASGTPVIALGKGGVLETVVENETGLFFHESSVVSLNSEIEKFESGLHGISSVKCRRRSEQFAPERFRSLIAKQISTWCAKSSAGSV